jgi:hypothetical protein
MSVARVSFSPDEQAKIRSWMASMLFLAIVQLTAGGMFLSTAFYTVFYTVASLFPMFGSVDEQVSSEQSMALGESFTERLFVSAVGSGLAASLLGGIVVVASVFLVKARTAFGNVLKSDGNDQAFLAHGFSDLRNFFLLEIVFFAVLMAMSLFTVVGVAVMG